MKGIYIASGGQGALLKNRPLNPHKTFVYLVFISFLLILFTMPINAQDRFPRPEFESGYKIPSTTTPTPRSKTFEILDIIILIAALALASYFSIKKRSRKHLYGLMIFSIAYFGFLREGCTCAVGSVQNISLGLADPSYILPLTAVIFFALPLIFALFYGRAFCAAVCPLGAAQDLVLQTRKKPVKLPTWLTQILSILPYIYLGLAILFAATGSAFIICRYDPFVGFFRLSAGFEMIILGLAFLLLSTFIGRPYCRFLCPYGALLGLMSRLSRHRVSVTPDTCIQCRLCEDACPNGAIREPISGKLPESRKKGVRRLAILIILLPVIMAAGGWAAAQLHGVTARMHPTVQLAEQIKMENSGKILETTLASRTFRSTGTPASELFNDALSLKNQFYSGGWILGAFLGLVFGLKLIGLSIRRSRQDYEPSPADCFNCGRCFNYCPKEHVEENTNEEHLRGTEVTSSHDTEQASRST